jgi:type III secretion system YscD/HrpQ family protein
VCLIGLTINFLPSGNESEASLKTLEQALSAEGFSGLWVEDNAGRVMIYGLVPTEADANKVRGIAARQSYPVQVIVRGREEFGSAIQNALAEHGLFVQVRIENGEAALLGYVLDSLTENAALSWARSAVPRVAPIRSSLITRGVVEDTLTAELTKVDLKGAFAVDWRHGVIVLSAEAADEDTLEGVAKAVRATLSSPIAFQLDIALGQKKNYNSEAVGRNDQAALPSRNYAPDRAIRSNPFGERLFLRSVTPAQHGGGAALPFITTSDGAVYFPGGTLPSGYTLTAIHADRLEFSRNGSTMAYMLQGR